MDLQTASSTMQFIDSSDESNIKSPGSFWVSSRFGLAVIAFLGFINLYALRINLSVTIVCMLNHTALHQLEVEQNISDRSSDHTASPQCTGKFSSNETKNENGEFLWVKSQQGLILGAFFWGYLVTQLPGGQLAERFGGKHIFGWNMVVAAVATLLYPVGAHGSYIILILLRIITGLCEGVAFPCTHAMWASWAPPLERSRLVGLSYAGNQIGNVIALPLAAILCDYFGWSAVFYFFGCLGLVWCAVWLFFVSNTPAEHKRISKLELAYITESLAQQMDESRDEGKSMETPWRQIVRSLPVWAIIVGHTCANFGTYLMLTSLPLFMDEVLNFNIKQNGLFSAIPYIVYYVGINIAGVTADYLLTKKILSTGHVRKLMMTVALFGQAAFFLAAAYCNCGQETLAVVMITLAQGISGFQYAGWVVNHVDIAPKYAGTLFGIGNTFATISGIVAPMVVAALTPHHSREEWRLVFWVASGILIFGSVFFVAFASGEVQWWAKPKSYRNQDEMKSIDRNAQTSNKSVSDGARPDGARPDGALASFHN